MRPIKFRARIATGLACSGQWIYWGLSGHDALDAVDTGTMGQFTGVIDSNGKEVFEGDIIRMQYLSRPAEIRFRNGKWVYQTKDGEFYGTAWDLYPHVIESTSSVINGQVIGNVYENPELLESGK